MNERDLNGARVLVVGASGGLGRQLCQALDARGALVIAGVRAEQAVDGARHCFIGDLTAPDYPRRAIAEATPDGAPLDGIIVASGVVAFAGLTETPDAVLNTLLELNAMAPLRLLRAFMQAPMQQRRDAFFAAISGVVAERAFPNLAAYAASKAALSMALRGATFEARKLGLDVLDARPPHTETQLSRHPIHGVAPKMPPGADPGEIAQRIVRGVEQRERELSAEAFTALRSAG